MSASQSPTIVPYLSYTSGQAALDFLTEGFGFKKNFAQFDDSGALVHAELALGNGVVLIGTADLPHGSPGIYIVVHDVQAHFEQAKLMGAEIVFEPETTEWGTQRYRCRDPEGHEWTFGTYQPQTKPPAWG